MLLSHQRAHIGNAASTVVLGYDTLPSTLEELLHFGKTLFNPAQGTIADSNDVSLSGCAHVPGQTDDFFMLPEDSSLPAFSSLAKSLLSTTLTYLFLLQRPMVAGTSGNALHEIAPLASTRASCAANLRSNETYNNQLSFFRHSTSNTRVYVFHFPNGLTTRLPWSLANPTRSRPLVLTGDTSVAFRMALLHDALHPANAPPASHFVAQSEDDSNASVFFVDGNDAHVTVEIASGGGALFIWPDLVDLMYLRGSLQVALGASSHEDAVALAPSPVESYCLICDKHLRGTTTLALFDHHVADKHVSLLHDDDNDASRLLRRLRRLRHKTSLGPLAATRFPPPSPMQCRTASPSAVRTTPRGVEFVAFAEVLDAMRQTEAIAASHPLIERNDAYARWAAGCDRHGTRWTQSESLLGFERRIAARRHVYETREGNGRASLGKYGQPTRRSIRDSLSKLFFHTSPALQLKCPCLRLNPFSQYKRLCASIRLVLSLELCARSFTDQIRVSFATRHEKPPPSASVRVPGDTADTLLPPSTRRGQHLPIQGFFGVYDPQLIKAQRKVSCLGDVITTGSALVAETIAAVQFDGVACTPDISAVPTPSGTASPVHNLGWDPPVNLGRAVAFAEAHAVDPVTAKHALDDEHKLVTGVDIYHVIALGGACVRVGKLPSTSASCGRDNDLRRLQLMLRALIVCDHCLPLGAAARDECIGTRRCATSRCRYVRQLGLAAAHPVARRGALFRGVDPSSVRAAPHDDVCDDCAEQGHTTADARRRACRCCREANNCCRRFGLRFVLADGEHAAATNSTNEFVGTMLSRDLANDDDERTAPGSESS